MRATEQEIVTPMLETLGISPLEWAANICQKSSDLVSRLYIFCPELRACITLHYSETSCVVINDLTPQGGKVVDWLKEYAGNYQLESSKARSILQRLKDFSVMSKEDCLTNSRGGIIFFHIMSSGTEEHCFKMLNPQIHEDFDYKSIVNLYSTEFLGGNIHL